jgi:catechol 2,3-dioxygenase-like lactoylglutathione lyase family enzyme
MSISELEHVLVLSDDVDHTRDFYCEVVGLQEGARPPLGFPGYWLYAGGVPCLHVADRRAYEAHAAWLGLTVDREPPGASSVDHIAFTASDYESVLIGLERRGVRAVRNDVPDGGPRQLFFEDPNGVRVEINVKTEAKAR